MIVSESFQQKYLDGLEELVQLHRELSSLEAIIAQRKQEVDDLKNSKKRKPNQVQQPQQAKKKRSSSSDHVYWLDVVIKHLPDSFDSLSPRKRQQIKESVYEFLRLKLDNDQIRKLERSNEEYDIPSRLVDPFVSWIKRQIAKITQVSPKKRTSIGTGGTQQKKTIKNSVPIWKTWAETIRQVVPTYRVESIHSHFAKSFLAEHVETIDRLKGEENIGSSSELCIPEELTKTFLDQFWKKFPNVKKIDSDQMNAAPKGSIMSPANSVDKALKITAWPDICNVMFPLEMEKIVSSLQLEKNVSYSVGKFVAEKISAMNIELAQCIVDSDVRKIKTFGIPLALESQFVGWFRGKLQTGFDAYVDSIEAIESGHGLQPMLVEEEIEEEDLNSLQISGLLEQLVNDPHSKNNGAKNDDPTSSAEFGAFESIPRPPSPIWSFSWLSESVNEDLPTRDIDIQPNAENITSENVNANEMISKNGMNAVISSDNSEILPSINANVGSDNGLNDFFHAETPPGHAVEPVTSPLGSSVELSPDCSPEAVRIEPCLPLPEQSLFKKGLFDAHEKDSLNDLDPSETIEPLKANAGSLENIVTAAEVEQLPKKPSNAKVLDDSPSRNTNISNRQMEPVGKKPMAEVQVIPSRSPTFQDMIRYNSIMLQLMPTYHELDRSTRMEFKSRVREFLISEFGENGVKNCAIIRHSKNESASTLGIPRCLEIAFKTVFSGLLRKEFGLKRVPFQKWELSLPFDGDETFGKQCGLIMRLIREVTESLRQFIRNQALFPNNKLKRNKPRPSLEKSNIVVKPGADNRQNEKDKGAPLKRSGKEVIVISESEESDAVPRKKLQKRRIGIIDSDSEYFCIQSKRKTTSGTTKKNSSGIVTPQSTPSRKRSRKVDQDIVLPAQVEKITATTLADLHDLKRYTRLILNIMPTFSKAPRLARMHIRDQVQKWLISNLGETFASECVIWTRTPSGQLFATLGIPKNLEDSFNEWMKDLLKDLSMSQSTVTV